MCSVSFASFVSSVSFSFGLHHHLGDVPWENIFNHGASAAANEFCECVQFRIDALSLTINIRSSITHLHGFQPLALLPYFIEITFCVCTNRISGS